MPGTFILEWENGRKEDIVGYSGYYYVFADCTLLSFHPQPAWCGQCREIRPCEFFENEAFLRKELADLSDPASARSQKFTKSPSPEFLEDLKQRYEAELRFVLVRRLPPSCLHCGQRQVSYFKEGEWAPHPGTGEAVKFYCVGMCTNEFPMNFYDVDGNPMVLTNDERKLLLEAIMNGKDL